MAYIVCCDPCISAGENRRLAAATEAIPSRNPPTFRFRAPTSHQWIHWRNPNRVSMKRSY